MGEGAGFGEMAELVAVVVVVGVGAELEVVPDAVVAQLDLGTAGEVAGEEGEDDVFARLQRLEERQDAGEEAAGGAGDFAGEVVEVAVEEGGDVFRGLGQPVAGEHVADDAGVGAAGDFDGGKIVVDAEAVAEAEAEGAFARAAGGEEGAVDVEEEEFFVHGPWGTLWAKAGRLSPATAQARERL